jgi:hypothetical protein
VSKATPRGFLNIANVPCPSSHPSVELPASVVTFQTHTGCALSPLTVHAVTGEHGTHAEIPSEYVPMGHVFDVKAHDVAPCVLKDPAPQDRQEAAEPAPIDAEYVPAAHGVHVELIAAPTNVLKVPARQGVHADTEEAPVRLL